MIKDRAGELPATSIEPPRGSLAVAMALLLVAFIGHASALWLVDVKPYADFQHYRTWQWLIAQRPIAVFAILVQTVIVVALVWRFRQPLQATIARVLSIRATVVILAFAGFSLAVPTVSISRFVGEVILAGAIALVALLNLLIVVLALPDSTTSRLAAWVDARVTVRPGAEKARPWDRFLPVAVAGWVSLLAAIASYVVLEHLPHIDDGVSNLFQAKYFAAGHLYLPSPPDLESFLLDLTVVKDGRWFGYAFPGWPAVLAIGVLAGVPWLVNPVIGGLLILFGHEWLRRRYDRGTANVAVLLLAASSWLIFTSAEFMGHALTALLVMLALLAFDHATEGERRWAWWSVLTGVATGMLMLTRAFDGIVLVSGLGLIALIDRRLVRSWRAILVIGLAATPVAALIFPYNQAVTGSATYPAHVAWADGHYGPGIDVLGFGPNVGITSWPNLDPLPGHGVADVILNLNKNLFMVNVDLLGWATGSLIFVWLAFGLGQWRRADVAMLAFPATYVIGYSAFWFSGGPDLGARYWYPIMTFFAALSVRGAQMLVADVEARGGLRHAGVRVGAFMAAATVSAAIVMLPWRAVTKHYRYRGVTGEVRELAASHDFAHALVFVRDNENKRDYQSAFVLNPWTLEDPGTIYAFDAGPANRATLVAHYPDRPVWVIGRATAESTGGTLLRVVEGPLAPGTVPR